jgi:hypothetical protein
MFRPTVEDNASPWGTINLFIPYNLPRETGKYKLHIKFCANKDYYQTDMKKNFIDNTQKQSFIFYLTSINLASALYIIVISLAYSINVQSSLRILILLSSPNPQLDYKSL